PALRHRLALLRGDLDLAVGGDRRRHVEDQRRLFECRHGGGNRVGREQHVDTAPGRQVVGVADREIEPDHVVLERHRGVDRGGAGMIAVAGADPADAIVAGQRDRLLDGAGYDEAAEAVIAIDHGGRPGLPDHRYLRARVMPATLVSAGYLGQWEEVFSV